MSIKAWLNLAASAAIMAVLIMLLLASAIFWFVLVIWAIDYGGWYVAYFLDYSFSAIFCIICACILHEGNT
jgi:hypothetical protein